MTRRMRLRRRSRAGEPGQAAVEFSLVIGIALPVLVGLIAGSWLLFQRSALHDGSTAGARMASMQTSLSSGTSPGPYCESTVPISIEQAVALASPQLNVNMSKLCSAGGGGPLTQTNDPTKVNITVTESTYPPSALTGTITVTLTYTAEGLGQPLRQAFAMTSSSTVPVRGPGASTTPSPSPGATPTPTPTTSPSPSPTPTGGGCGDQCGGGN